MSLYFPVKNSYNMRKKSDESKGCDGLKKWMFTVCVVVLALIFLGSGIMVGVYYWDAHQQESRYDDLAQLRPTDNTRPLPDNPEPEGETEPDDPHANMVEVTDPETGETRWILTDFAQLYRLNSDIIGWLKIPAVDVDYPVMYTPEDPEYYLRRNFDKEKNTRGCLFVQAGCDVFTPSDNVTIYGHRMRDGTMFGQLQKFRKASFRDENPYIYFDTLTQLHTYEIMSVFLTTASVGQGFAYHGFVNAGNPEEFDAFVKQCKKLALYDTGVDAQYGDKLICLSTCEYSQTNGRLVVVAKRVA